MASLISKDDFDGIYFIDTNNSGVQIMLQKYIDYIEAKYPIDVTDENESKVKEMYVGFTYFEYVRDTYNQNTPVGNVQQQIPGERTLDESKLIRAYNNAVDIYNELTDSELNYVTFIGI